MTTPQPTSIAEAVTLGREYRNNNDYASAIAVYSHALTTAPQSLVWERAYLRSVRGICYARQGGLHQHNNAYYPAIDAYTHADRDFSYVLEDRELRQSNESSNENEYYIKFQRDLHYIKSGIPQFLQNMNSLVSSIKNWYKMEHTVLDSLHTAWLENQSNRTSPNAPYLNNISLLKAEILNCHNALRPNSYVDLHFRPFIKNPSLIHRVDTLQQTIYNDLLQQPKFRNDPAKLVGLNNTIKQHLPDTGWLRETLPERTGWRDWLCSSSSAQIVPQGITRGTPRQDSTGIFR